MRGSQKTSMLDMYMNGEKIGILHRDSSGRLAIVYAEEWLESEKCRPLSLSLPVTQKRHNGDVVNNFFDNLLPDSRQIINRIQTRFTIPSDNSFDILSYIGQDCIGAIQLLPFNSTAPDIKKINVQTVSDKQIAEILKNYQVMPLGMNSTDNFRISISGAQEKTGLLRYKGKWCRPLGPTPTSHIFKLPIGMITQSGIDLSESVENEWLCHLLLKEFDIPTADMDIFKYDNVKALIVKRFDRVWSDDKSWLIRLPQEDLCQAKGLSSAFKYESDGGPGIKDILQILQGSSDMQADSKIFMKTVFVFWLLGAIDGHAKNFSIFIYPGGSFRLTPVYDVLSAYPLISQKQLPKQKLKMAMSVRGKSVHYKWYNIRLQHWMSNAKYCRFSENIMSEIIDTTVSSIDKAIANVSSKLPLNFPRKISDPIFEFLLKMKYR